LECWNNGILGKEMNNGIMKNRIGKIWNNGRTEGWNSGMME
jgi:hypothetical protein